MLCLCLQGILVHQEGDLGLPKEGLALLTEDAHALHLEDDPVHQEEDLVRRGGGLVHPKDDPVHQENDLLHLEGDPLRLEDDPLHQDDVHILNGPILPEEDQGLLEDTPDLQEDLHHLEGSLLLQSLFLLHL